MARSRKKESGFQDDVRARILKEFPGSLVLKQTPYLQGIPDTIVLYGKSWAALELKKSKDAPTQPNQPYYVDRMNEMSYASFVYPENVEEVFDELHKALQP